MSKRINKVKVQSALKKWMYWRERGVYVLDPTIGKHRLMRSEELDVYTDTGIWLAEHPGQEPIEVIK